MLHHVRTQQRIGKPIQRRPDRDPDRRQPKHERGQPPRRKLRSPRPPNDEPPANRDGRDQNHWRSQEDRRRPIRKDGPVLRRHWNRVSATPSAPWAEAYSARSSIPYAATHRSQEPGCCPAVSRENAPVHRSPTDSEHSRRTAYFHRPAAPAG